MPVSRLYVVEPSKVTPVLVLVAVVLRCPDAVPSALRIKLLLRLALPLVPLTFACVFAVTDPSDERLNREERAPRAPESVAKALPDAPLTLP